MKGNNVGLFSLQGMVSSTKVSTIYQVKDFVYSPVSDHLMKRDGVQLADIINKMIKAQN